MALGTEVGHVNTGSGATRTITVATAPGAGDLLVCGVASPSRVASSVTDSRGNTWTIDKTVINSDALSVASTVQNVAALQVGDTITITFSASTSSVAAVVHDFPGYTNTVDISATNSSGATATTARNAGSVTTTNASDLVYAAHEAAGADTSFTPATGYSSPTPSFYAASTVSTIEVEWQAVSVTGTYNPTGTGGASLRTAGAAIAYKAAGGGAIANTLTASPGSMAISGSAVTPPVAHSPSVSPGSMTVTGSLITPPVSHKPALSPGSYAITGSAATVPIAHRPTLSAGSFAITGFPATPKIVHSVSVSPASYTITGSSTTSPVSRRLNASPAAMAVTGSSATLVGPGGPVVQVDINVQRPYASLWIHPY